MQNGSLIRRAELDAYVREQARKIKSKDVSLAMVSAAAAGNDLAKALNRLPIQEQFATQFALYKQYELLCKLLERNLRLRWQ